MTKDTATPSPPGDEASGFNDEGRRGGVAGNHGSPTSANLVLVIIKISA